MATVPVAAQEEGGVLWRFGITQSFETESNPGLARPDAARESFAETGLSLEYSTVTATQSLTFGASGNFEFGNVDDNGFRDPSLSFGYTRQNASTRLTTQLFLRERDVDALAFDLGLDTLGNPIVITTPDTGTRRRFGGSVGVTWGLDTPFGGGLTFSHTDTTFSNTTDPNLVDSTRTGLSGNLRFNLTPVTTLTLGGSVSDLDEDGIAATSRTESLNLGLSLARPNGDIGLSAGSTTTASGTRTNLSLSRSLDLPLGSVSGRIGIERGVFGGTGFSGGLVWQQERPNGSVNLSLSHDLSQDSRDSEIRRTQASIGLNQLLQPRLSGRVNLGLSSSETTQTGVTTTTASLTAGLTYELTEDWGLGLSATHRIEDQDGLTRASSTSLSLSMSRTFEFRP